MWETATYNAGLLPIEVELVSFVIFTKVKSTESSEKIKIEL